MRSGIAAIGLAIPLLLHRHLGGPRERPR